VPYEDMLWYDDIVTVVYYELEQLMGQHWNSIKVIVS
jgi:hypothetical protein